MHVLLTNDDGPLDDVAAPYIKPFIDELHHATDWTLLVITPDVQRLWIGKAHFLGANITPEYLYPTNQGNQFDGPFREPQPDQPGLEWLTLDSTPAACADIGVNHAFAAKGEVDLVVSGPNLGRNSGALFLALSGTLGAAMEAALNRKKAVALLFLFDGELKYDLPTIEKACRLSVRVVQHLASHWDPSVDVYLVNVPLVSSLLDDTPVHYTEIFHNRWRSMYKPNGTHFEWAPDFDGVGQMVTRARDQGQFNDAVCLENGWVSVTPLRAAFATVPATGTITLDPPSASTPPHLEASGTVALTIDPSSYIHPIITAAVKQLGSKVHLSHTLPQHKGKRVVHFGEYEELDFDRVGLPHYHPCAYVYRKALIRKHHLAHTVHMYVVKHPESALVHGFPATYQLEVDYAEFLDEALDDAYELRDAVEAGTSTWILKPSMSDRGQGIRMFRTIEQLQAIFDSFEVLDSEDEDEGEHGVMASQLRHFVVQQYLPNPLLLSQYRSRKFHIRTYVVCTGALQVYVYRQMLALFAASTFQDPANDDEVVDLAGHLTNTCLQEDGQHELVEAFWQLQGVLPGLKHEIFDGVCTLTGEVFKAAATVDRMGFQPLEHGFEVYGLDFLVDTTNGVHLLEVNAYPDFKQTGLELQGVVSGLFADVVGGIVSPLMGGPRRRCPDLVQVLDLLLNEW